MVTATTSPSSISGSGPSGRAAGSEDYVTALARQLPDQILFGSVYPNCGPLTDLRRIVAGWKLPPHIERKYLRDNAARILGL